MSRLRRTLIGVVGLALLIGALAGFVWALQAGTVLAADPTPTPPSGSQPAPSGPGTVPFGGPRGFGGSGMMGRAGGPFGPQSSLTILSEKLGLTPQEVQTERQSGKSLAQIAASKGMDEATLIAALLDPRKAALDQSVKDGRLTQAQADQAYQWIQDRIKQMVERTEVGPNPPSDGSGPGLGPCGGASWGMGFGPRGRTQ